MRWTCCGGIIYRKSSLPLLAKIHFDGTIAVQARQMVEETEWLLQLADWHDFIKGVVGWVDLRSPAIATQLERFSKHPKLVGVRHVVHDEPDDQFMLFPDFRRGIARLQEFHLTYDLLLFPRHLPVAVKLVGEFPDQPFVLDHIAKPAIREGQISPWKEHLQALAEFPNVFCKLSGMVTEAKWQQWRPEDFQCYLDIVVEAFGVERVMIGSDWPVCTLSGDYESTMRIVMDYTRQFPADDARRDSRRQLRPFLWPGFRDHQEQIYIMNQTMLAAVLHAAKDIRLEQYAQPELSAGMVLLRVRRAGICGSDLHYFEHGYCAAFVPTRPFILGHEFTAEVVAVADGVDSVEAGARVTVNPARSCGFCEYCKSGRPNLCRKIIMLGSASTRPPTNGAFAEFVTVRADQCHSLPADMDDSLGAMMEPFAVALHAVKRAEPFRASVCLVVGGGPIGLLRGDDCTRIRRGTGRVERPRGRTPGDRTANWRGYRARSIGERFG